jgi:hypothetical protein
MSSAQVIQFARLLQTYVFVAAVSVEAVEQDAVRCGDGVSVAESRRVEHAVRARALGRRAGTGVLQVMVGGAALRPAGSHEFGYRLTNEKRT